MHLVDQHIQQFDWTNKKLLVACSGGLDSVALVHSLLKNHIPFAVLHVNYQLREQDSENDQAFVEQLCASNSIPLRVIKCPTTRTKGEGINLQQAARDFRRTLFSQWKVQSNQHFVVLAHHQNDQIETFFLQHYRGSGSFGLRGMLAESDQLLRPFLGLSKEDLRNYASTNTFSWCEDISNTDSKYLRNLFRNELLPKLHAEIPSLTESILTFQSVLNLSVLSETEDSETWIRSIISAQFIETEDWNSRSELTHLLFLKALNLPSWLLKRLTECFHLNLSAEVFCQELCFYKGSKGIYIRPKTPIQKHWEYKIENRNIPETCKENEKLLYHSEIDQRKLQIRSVTKNDKIQLAGMQGKKRIWELLKEAGIPSQIRSEWQVLLLDNQVIWVPKLATSDSPFTKNDDSSTKTISLIEKVK